MALEDFFTWGSGGRKMTPDQLAAERAALAVMQAREGDTSPVAHWSQGLGRVVNALAGNYRESKADKAEAAGIAQGQAAMDPVLAALMGGGSGGGYTAGGGASSAAAPEDALGLIREFEGFRETPYWDVNAYRTGYGSDTITMPDGSVVPVAQGMSVSRDDAERDLSRRVGTEFIPRAQEAVGPDVWAALNPQQQSSLASITYNYGSLPSSVAAAVQTPGIEDDVAAIRGLATHNGGINAGRRNREADIYGGVAGMGGQPQTTVSTQGKPSAGGDIISLLMAAQADPWARKQYGPVIDALMGSELSTRAQAQDPMYQLGLQKAQMEVDAMRNPGAPKPIEVGGVLLDPTTYQPIFDSRAADVPEPYTLRTGETRYGADNQPLASGPAAVAPRPLTNAQEREAWGIPATDTRPYAIEEGKPPQLIGGSGVTVNNDLSGGGKFEEAFAKGDAATIETVYNSGLAAQRNLGRIDQLEGLLAASPTGLAGTTKQLAGEWGINTEGLDTLQSAQAIINSLVPEQRQPGSGPMSDADLALFKQSLPRIVNQPGGNKIIVDTMRAIAQYDADGARIVQDLRSGKINRAEAFDALQNRPNPLSGAKVEGASDIPDDLTPAEKAALGLQ
jgi:GH24 family phage-related lysozyme (muramidase)